MGIIVLALQGRRTESSQLAQGDKTLNGVNLDAVIVAFIVVALIAPL